jgi:L-idonate 5-dehydrogenase
MTIDAVRLHAIGDLRIDKLPRRAANPDEAVVRIEYGGICGSDIHYWHSGAVGPSVLKAPMILGHEVVGVVEEAARDGSGVGEGAAVVVNPAQTCGKCRWCKTGRQSLCPNYRYLGSAAHSPHTDGGFATRLTVASSRLLPLPTGLDHRRAALAEPAAVAWHAVGRAEAVGGHLADASVLVVGAGPIGLLVAAVTRYRSARSVTVIDTRRRPLDMAAQVGADRTFTVEELSKRSRLLEADITFEASGSTEGMATALHGAGRSGIVVAIGQLARTDHALPAWLIVSNELRVTGSLRLEGELPTALDFLADPAVRLDPMITHVFPLHQAAEAFSVAADADQSSKVLLEFSRPR